MQLTDLEVLPTPTTRELARRAHSRGMTLIEILVVLAIIGLIMGGVAVMASNALDNARIETAGTDIKNYVSGVEMYSIQKKGKCPKSLDDLKAAGVIKKVNQDPWGNDYVIKCPGEHGEVDISSAGPDGEFGSDDDINSWDDAAPADKKE